MTLLALHAIFHVECVVLFPVFRLGSGRVAPETGRRLLRFFGNAAQSRNFLGFRLGQRGVGLRMRHQQHVALLVAEAGSVMTLGALRRAHVDRLLRFFAP